MACTLSQTSGKGWQRGTGEAWARPDCAEIVAPPGDSRTWPVRIWLHRVTHRPVFLRIAWWRLDGVSVRLRVFDRRFFRFGGLRARGSVGLVGHERESQARRLGSAMHTASMA